MGNFIIPISSTFGTSMTSVSAYITIKGIAMVVAIPLVSFLLKRIKLKVLLTAACLGYAGSLWLISSSHDLFSLYTYAIGMGLFSSFFSTITVPLLIHHWFHQHRSIYLGIAFAASGIAGALISPIIAATIAKAGWRTAVQIIVLIELFVLLPALLSFAQLKPDFRNTFPIGFSSKLSENAEENVRLRKLMKTQSFWLAMIFGASLALSNGFFFVLPSMAKTMGSTVGLGAYLVSWALIGATIGKIAFGIINVYIKPNRVTFLAGCIGMIGILLVYFGLVKPVLAIIGAFMYGFLISLMTLEPPILVHSMFSSLVSDKVFVYVSMAVQLSYVMGPTIYSMFYDFTQHYSLSLLINFIFVIIAILTSNAALKLERKDKLL